MTLHLMPDRRPVRTPHRFLLLLAAAFVVATSALGVAVYQAVQPPACEVRHG